MNYVIVGNSAAAIGAVEGLRSLDPTGKVTLLSAEKDHTYSRPLISYLLAGKVSESAMNYRPADFYQKAGVEVHFGAEVTAVDPVARTVTTRGGQAFTYDRLLLATGGRPFVPQIEGVEGSGAFTFTSYDDARRIESYLQAHPVKQAVVVGGGMIGLKATEALMARGVKVTIIELADRLLAAAFDQTAGQIMAKALTSHGVEVRLQTTVKEVLRSGGTLSRVLLAGGQILDCQLLIVAIGVVPSIAYLGGSGLETNRGIVVDDHMRTSDERVYAAGDVAEAYDLLLGQKRPIPILPLAFRQGLIAGRNMAGADETYLGGMAMNSIEVCDLPTISVGVTTGPEADGQNGYEVLRDLQESKNIYRKIVLKNNRIVGLILVGDVDRAGIYTGLIERRVDVGAIKQMLLSDEFGLLSLDAEYRKHVVSGPGIEV